MKTNRSTRLHHALSLFFGAAAFAAIIAFAVSPIHADVTLAVFASLSLGVAFACGYAPPRPRISTAFRPEIPARFSIRESAAHASRRVVPALTERR